MDMKRPQQLSPGPILKTGKENLGADMRLINKTFKQVGRRFIVGLILLFAGEAIAADGLSEITVLRKQAQMRKGPASYYEVLAVIPEKTRLTPSDLVMGWYKIQFENQTGFISSKITQPLAPKEDVFGKMAVQSVDVKLSRHGMSAGAKGFAQRFSKQIKSRPEDIDRIAAYHLDSKAHADFADETYKKVAAMEFQRHIGLPPGGTRSAYTEMEQGVGLSIAGKIGSMTLMNSAELTRYVNQVGQLVVTASSGFDLPFAFFIIDDAEAVNAYACPGGYIFVTRGLLMHIRDEAELAAVLAHEVAHVIYQHGLQELEHRRPMIVADNAFAELEKETGGGEDSQKWQSIEASLDEFALNAYETIFEGRLSRYELDADRIALIYTARSGYDPNALMVLLARLKKAKTASTNEHYTIEQLAQRLQGIGVALNSVPPHPKYFRFTQRWRQQTASLR